MADTTNAARQLVPVTLQDALGIPPPPINDSILIDKIHSEVLGGNPRPRKKRRINQQLLLLLLVTRAITRSPVGKRVTPDCPF